jgi:hypothetical protein
MILKVYNNLAIPPGPGERFADIAMQARANLAFHGFPWYSDLAIQMDENNEEVFGRSYLFFKAQFTQFLNNEVVTKELVFVNMYDTVSSNSLKYLVDCEEICLSDKWMVVDSQSILRLVHIVPNFASSNSSKFFINKYKF